MPTPRNVLDMSYVLPDGAIDPLGVAEGLTALVNLSARPDTTPEVSEAITTLVAGFFGTPRATALAEASEWAGRIAPWLTPTLEERQDAAVVTHARLRVVK